MDQMVALAGVGRKTANVVLGTAFGMATGVVVDTHVTRLSRRLGLTTHTDADQDRTGLDGARAEKRMGRFRASHDSPWPANLRARKPKCPVCSMKTFCPKIGVETKIIHVGGYDEC